MLPSLSPGGNVLPLPHSPPLRPRTLERWKEIGEALADPHFELTVEDAAPLFSTFSQPCRAGVEFDPTLTALVRHLQRQAFAEDGESDVDHRRPDGRSEAA